MPKSRIPSPARSQGAPLTPRRYPSRGSRSVASPARSTASGRLSNIVDQFKEKNRQSFALSPLDRTFLSDNTDIEVPRRKSWWKNVENSRDVIEVLENEKPADPTNVLDVLDLEILSQEKKASQNYTLDLPESSEGESISSIVVPQRRLFTQKENVPQTKFGSVIDKRDTTKQNKTLVEEKIPNAGPKNLFSQAKRSKPNFPSALLAISPDKTIANKTKHMGVEIPAPSKNLFGNRPGTKRKNMFADFIVSDSEDDIPEIRPKKFAFPNSDKIEPIRRSSANSRGAREPSPATSITTEMNLDDWKQLPSSTLVDHQIQMHLTTPGRRSTRLSKLSEAKESTNADSSRHSNRSISSKNKSKVKSPSQSNKSAVNKSKSEQNVSSAKNDNKMVVMNDNYELAEEQNKNQEVSEEQKENQEDKQNESQKVDEELNESQKVDKQIEDQVVDEDLNESEDDDNEHIENQDIGEEENESEEELNENKEDNEEQNATQEVAEEHDASKTVNEKQNKSQEVVKYADSSRNSNKSLSSINKSKAISPSQSNKSAVNKSKSKKNASLVKSDMEQNVEQNIHEEQNEGHNVDEEQNGKQEVDEEQNEIQEVDEVINKDQEIDKEQNESQCADTQQDTSQEVEERNESQEVDEEQNEIEVDEEHNENQDVDEEQNEQVLDEEDQSQEIDKEKDESQEIDKEQDESQELDEENNESQEVEEDNNESQEVEEDNNEIMEVEEDNNESQEVEEDNNESQEVEEENNESQEVEEETDESLEVEEKNNESQEVEEENNESQEVEEENNESQEVEEEYESQESENEEIENQDDIDRVIIENSQHNENDEEDNQNQNESLDNDAENHLQNQEIETEENEVEISHDTTGRNRQKHEMNSPEAILHDMTNDMDSFTAKGRNTSIRKTKSILKNFTIRPSMAPARESTGLDDGTKNSSAEGSGWDSHRTTRKTIRETFGRGFTPRKSLRAMVMEKSAKRQTLINEANAGLKLHQANSTEIPVDNSEMQYDEIDPIESDHEISIKTRQTTLEMYLQKIKIENMERKQKIEEQVRNSLKSNPVRMDVLNFRVPSKPSIKRAAIKPQVVPKVKRKKSSIIAIENLPPELLDDMKYKPPKRFRPSNASWITNRLYKFLETKLEPKYDYKARVRAEKLVEMIYNFVRNVRRFQVAPPHDIAELKREMARLDIVHTHFEFYNFFNDYLPMEIKVKVVPDIVNDIPLPIEGVFSPILV